MVSGKVVRMNQQQLAKRKILYYSCLFPCVTAFLFSFIPSPALSIGLFTISMLALNFLGTGIAALYGVHRDQNGYLSYLAVQMDIFSLFALLIPWRVWGQSTLVLIILLVYLALGIFVGNHYYEWIVQVSNDKLRGRGRLVQRLLGAAALFSGGMPYLIARMGEHLGSSFVTNIFVIILPALALYTIAGIHAIRKKTLVFEGINKK